MNKIIYADNAATTKLNSKAYNAMLPYLTEQYGNPSQPYSFSRNVKHALKEAKDCIANCINASPNEIFFTSGGTESDNWAIKGCAFAFKDRKKIITSDIEHHAIIRSCEFLHSLNYPVNYIKANNKGVITSDALANYITSDTGLVSVMLANNEIGSIQPISELTKIAHKSGSLFHTDAVQAIGHINVDVKQMDVDLLSASAHKFGGPRGIGFLFIRKGTNILPYMNGGSQEQYMRAGTENVAAIVAMAVALKESLNQYANTFKLISLEKALINRLSENKLVYNKDYIINGAVENKLPGLLSLSFKNIEGETLLHRLDLMGIMISTGAACDSVKTEVSHVIKSIDVPAQYRNGTIRISLNYENTIDEAIKIADSISKVIKA